jgi:hypothetical protein
MKAICKMTDKEVDLPCSSAGCPLFGDCLSAYEKATATAKPQTNADHIRSMTDEELAVAICQTQDQCSCCELTETDGSCTETLCVNAMVRWLKQPYKEVSRHAVGNAENGVDGD